jgi:Diguanylate cyclase, GGDEF domain
MHFNSSEILLLVTSSKLACCGLIWYIVANQCNRESVTVRSFVAFNLSLSIGLLLKAVWCNSGAALSKEISDLLILGSVAAVINGVYAFQKMQVSLWTLPALALIGAVGIIVFGLIIKHEALRSFSVIGPFIILVLIALSRNIALVRKEFGLRPVIFAVASVLASIAGLLLLTFLIWTGVAPVNLEQSGRANVISVLAIMISSLGINASYGYFCMRRSWVRDHEPSAHRQHSNKPKFLVDNDFYTQAEHLWHQRREYGITGVLITVKLRWILPPQRSSNPVDDVFTETFATLFQSVFHSALLIGRIGPNEFAAVISPATTAQATTLSERLIRRVHRKRWTQSQTKVALDIGMAFDAEHDQGSTMLIVRARNALNSAQSEGSDCIVYA